MNWRSLLVGSAMALLSQAVSGAERPGMVERVSCSSLAQAKQPAEKALPNIAALGFKWVDLSCLNWAAHVSVPKLLQNFEAEAGRVQRLLAGNKLGVSNLTFDAPDAKPFDQYWKEWEAVVKLSVRLKAPLINVMAPGAKADRTEAVARLRKMQELAARARVSLTVETHVGQMTERPADALALCRDVPGLGLTLDPSHFYAGPNQGKAFVELYPYVRGTGLRAGGMDWASIQMPWGEGPIDFAAVVKRLEAAGYKGYYVVEYIEGFNKLDALEQSRKFLEWARKQ